MSGVALTLRDEPVFDVDLSDVIPENLLSESLDSICRRRIAYGKRRVALGDFFDVAATDTESLCITNVTPKLRRLGSSMTSGTLEVSGNAGDELGATMSGGAIKLRGNAGDYVGGAMTGGSISVSGNTGKFTGGALPGAALGMRNGVICVEKSAGPRAGDRMRRGLLIVNGNCDRYCGNNIIAGTIIVSGQTEAGVGLGMRRGTIVTLNTPTSIPATFNDCGDHSLAIVALLTRYVKSINKKAYSRLRAMSAVRRYVGDIGADGQGEILVGVS